MYVAGTSSMQDAWDDLKLPLGLVHRTLRYRQAKGVYDQAQGGVKRVVGHSLGAAVANRLQQDFGLRYDLYANPGWRPFAEANPHSHRQRGDPISMFDNGVTVRPMQINPHGYTEGEQVRAEPGGAWG